MRRLWAGGAARWGLTALAWLLFYLTVHFNVNDERYSFWLPMKFVVAAPQVLFSLVMAYGFGGVVGRPLDAPVGRLLLYLLAGFVLLHVVYYYALAAAQPLAPLQSVTHQRWAGFMAGQGPLYFLRNPHYLLTVSPYLFFSQLCLPLGARLLADAWREQQHLAAARRQQLTWELAAVRQRLQPAFLQQTLAHITRLLDHHQAPTAAEATLKLAQVLRHTLYESRAPHAPLPAELNAYLDYVQLQELRLQDQLDISLHLTVTHAERYTILTGILLPLTEQYLTLAATTAAIELRVQGAQLTLRLAADCAPGHAAPVVAAVQARLAHYAGGGYQLVPQPTATGLSLTLHLPLLAL